MTFVAKIIDEKRYVRLDFDGTVTISELEQSRTILKSTLHESNGYKKIFVDLQKASLAVSTIDIRRFVSSHKNELPAGCMIAVFVHSKDWDAAQFTEDVAYIHGVFLRVFRNELHAYNWLEVPVVNNQKASIPGGIDHSLLPSRFAPRAI